MNWAVRAPGKCRILPHTGATREARPVPIPGEPMNSSADVDSEVHEHEPISAFGEAQPPTDAERYRWIRANRSDAALHAALRHAHFDHDFNDQIDAAMRAQREEREPTNLHQTIKPFGRRRSDFE